MEELISELSAIDVAILLIPIAVIIAVILDFIVSRSNKD